MIITGFKYNSDNNGAISSSCTCWYSCHLQGMSQTLQQETHLGRICDQSKYSWTCPLTTDPHVHCTMVNMVCWKVRLTEILIWVMTGQICRLQKVLSDQESLTGHEWFIQLPVMIQGWSVTHIYRNMSVNTDISNIYGFRETLRLPIVKTPSNRSERSFKSSCSIVGDH